MPTVQAAKRWRAELNEILEVCAQWASLPGTLPHCAICARYATDNLPFEALMSLLDVMPGEMVPEALAIAADRLSAVPPAMRGLGVNAVTLPALMDSPGWPLVRSLFINSSDKPIQHYFDDPRLGTIEDIGTFGSGLEPAFKEALFNARGLVNVRSLNMYSAEYDKDMPQEFWESPLARQLERIDGVPYHGDPVIGPLAVRDLSLPQFGNITKAFSLRQLLDPATTPSLTKLSIGAYSDLGRFFRLLKSERALLERIDNVSLDFSDTLGRNQTQLLRSAILPTSTKTVSWYSELNSESRLHLPGPLDEFNCEHPLFDLADKKVDTRLGDKVTHYLIGDKNIVFDWRLRSGISRRVVDLALLLPLEVDLKQVARFCDLIPGLKKLTLVYPFTEAEIETLLNEDRIRRLDALTLHLCVENPDWDTEHSNKYVRDNATAYQSKASAKCLFQLAFGERAASIPSLSILTESFILTRSPDRIQHCDLETTEAAHALIECNPRLPIEKLQCDLTSFDERLAQAFAKSDVLGRVFRLELGTVDLDAAAARVFAGCEHLRTVRAFSYRGYHHPREAIQAMLYSPNLTGAWEVDLRLPDPEELPGIDALCAGSPLLDRAVILGYAEAERSALLPKSGRLGRVRHLRDGMRVLGSSGDARIAKVWHDHPIGRPLRAELADFLERTYRVDYKLQDLPKLEKKLPTHSPLEDWQGSRKIVCAVLATAFSGKPAPKGKRFADLSEPQQGALRAIARLDDDWWESGLIQDVIPSYGFLFTEKKRLRAYIAGKEPACD